MKKISKEEKLKIKEEKRKKKEEQIKRSEAITGFNEGTANFIVITILFVLVLILNIFIMYFSSSYAHFIIKYVYNPIYGLIYYVASLIPKFNIVYMVSYFVLIIILLGLMVILENSKSNDLDKLNNYYNHVTRIFIVVIILFSFSSLYGMYIQNFTPNFDDLLFPETKNKTYDPIDYVRLNEKLRDDIIKYSSVIDRDSSGYVKYNGNYNKDVVKSLKNIKDDIDYLGGLYPTKSGDFDDKMRNNYGSTTIGLTTNYYTYFDYSLDPISVLITMTHEYCHTKGIGRENEAVYCSYLAGIKSNNVYLEYAATIEAFYRANNALINFDMDTATDIYEDITPLCMDKNYSEICDLGLHNTNEFIKGSNSINLHTYYLSNYKGENKDNLIKSLNVLSDNGAIFKIKDKKVSLDKVIDCLNNGDDIRIGIYIYNYNKKVFEKIKSSISDKKLYLVVFQDNGEDPVNDNSDLKSYYLAPFKEGKFDKLKLNYGSYYYNYDRSTRLILEYYDKNKIY